MIHVHWVFCFCFLENTNSLTLCYQNAKQQVNRNAVKWGKRYSCSRACWICVIKSLHKPFKIQNKYILCFLFISFVTCNQSNCWIGNFLQPDVTFAITRHFELNTRISNWILSTRRCQIHRAWSLSWQQQQQHPQHQQHPLFSQTRLPLLYQQPWRNMPVCSVINRQQETRAVDLIMEEGRRKPIVWICCTTGDRRGQEPLFALRPLLQANCQCRPSEWPWHWITWRKKG